MIQKNSIIPLYEQVAKQLRKDIICGKYGEHGSLETHNELANYFGVSIITIRKAIQILESEGMVDVLQGKGTFVRNTNLVDPLENLTGISSMMVDMNVKTNISVPVFEIIDIPKWISRDVTQLLGNKCLHIVRIVSVKDKAIAYANMFIPEKYCHSFSKSEVEESTVYQIFRDKLGISLGRGRQIIRAVGATDDIAKSLNINENCPLLQIERRAYDSNKNLIEYMILSYEASKYSFEIEMDLA